jgi:hypothetical protein
MSNNNNNSNKNETNGSNNKQKNNGRRYYNRRNKNNQNNNQNNNYPNHICCYNNTNQQPTQIITPGQYTQIPPHSPTPTNILSTYKPVMPPINQYSLYNSLFTHPLYPINPSKYDNNENSLTIYAPKSESKNEPERLFSEEFEKNVIEGLKKENKIKKQEWLSLEINNLDDLIALAKDYNVKYTDDIEYNIDIKMINSMILELEELNKLIGLNNIKKQIVDLILYYALKLDNKNHDLLHTVIEGEPGTGKTELAEKLSKIYLKIGILKNNVFKKVKRSDLIAGFLGQTAIKTAKVLEECKGGVLFIDEAYSLGNSEGKDGRDTFSKECIDILNQWLTENKSEFVCIIAGYKDDLSKSFFSYNSGLERRFPIRFSIDTYEDSELALIFIKKVNENEWNIECNTLNEIIKNNRELFKYNGGDMEVLFSKTKIAHAKNLLKKQNKRKKVIDTDDVIEGIEIYKQNPEIKKRCEKTNKFPSFYI